MYGSTEETVPQFRVYLCGPFQVERRVGETFVPVGLSEWQGRTGSRTVFKALLGCPGRQARRDALLALLWPDDDPQQVGPIVQKAVASVRHLFGSCLLEHGPRSNLYQLAPQEQLWVDVDAAQQLLASAEQRGRTSAQALPLLEEAAGYLTRGTFLEEEEGEWVRSKQETVERLRSRSQLWLAEALLTQGRAGQAETVLTALWERDPFDEGVLRRLLALLCQQGMKRQALRLYAQAARLFEQEGIAFAEETEQCVAHLTQMNPSSQKQAFQLFCQEKPSPAVREVPGTRDGSQDTLEDQEEDLRPEPHIQDGAEYLRTSQIQRPKRHQPEQQHRPPDIASPIENTQNLFPFSFSSSFPQDIMEALNILERMMRVVFDPFKRRTLQQIVAAFLTTTLPDAEAWKHLVQDTPAISSLAPLNSAVLEHFEHLILLSWRLGKGGQHDLTTARAISSSCLPSLTAFAQQPSLYQKHAADLAAQCYRLYAILAYHSENVVTADVYAKQAVHYSTLAGIPDLLITCLVLHAQIQLYANTPESALHTCVQAEQHLASATPAVQSYFYRIKAACLAQLAQEPEALTALELAYETFYRQPPTETPFVHVAHDEFELFLWDGITRYQINQFDQAEQSWKQADFQRPSPVLPERVRTGFLNNRVFAELRRPGRDKERCIALWQDAMQAAFALQSELRYSEVVRAYHEMQVAFPADSQVRALREQVRKWT